MNNERLAELLAYLDGLTKLASVDGFFCVREVEECIGWIREVLTEGNVD